MKTTENHLEYWKRMKENARKQNTQLAFGFWSGVIAAYEAAQQKMHLTALGGALIGFILGSGITALYFIFTVIGGRQVI